MESSSSMQRGDRHEGRRYISDRYRFDDRNSNSIDDWRERLDNRNVINSRSESRGCGRNDNDLVRHSTRYDRYVEEESPTASRQSYSIGDIPRRQEYQYQYGSNMNRYLESSPDRVRYSVDRISPSCLETSDTVRRTNMHANRRMEDYWQETYGQSTDIDGYNECEYDQSNSFYTNCCDSRTDPQPRVQRVQYVTRSESDSYDDKKYSESVTYHSNKNDIKHENKQLNRFGNREQVDSRSKVKDSKNIDPRSMIEVAPGEFLRLRGADETWKAVHNDFYMPCQCICCDLMLFCIQDAVSVLCPTCYVVSPLEGGVLHDEHDGGVGLGFTIESLAKWQEDIRRKGTSS